MKSVKIFCEGITDQVFIADCLEIFYGFNFDRKKVKHSNNEKLEITSKNKIEIIDVGGCDKLSDDIYIFQLEDNQDLGGINIVIFDADYTGLQNGNKGFNSCKQKLDDIKKNNSVVFDYFIWPNNNEDGVVENLLRTLIPTEMEVVYKCIESHQTCLTNTSIQNLKIADLKEKVGYYLHTVNQDSRARNRDYKDNVYWNLNCETNNDLKRFKDFLDTFFL